MSGKMTKTWQDRLLDGIAFIPWTSCWEWQGCRSPKGYGSIGVNGKVIKTHRAAWIAENGPIPEGLNVLHKCDNPACCRVEHLFLGTNTDNIADKVVKGRVKGELATNVKLSETQVKEILSTKAKGRAITRLARQYGVARTTIGGILSRRTWSHVEVAA